MNFLLSVPRIIKILDQRVQKKVVFLKNNTLVLLDLILYVLVAKNLLLKRTTFFLHKIYKLKFLRGEGITSVKVIKEQNNI